jgi:hypothetical protein
MEGARVRGIRKEGRALDRRARVRGIRGEKGGIDRKGLG